MPSALAFLQRRGMVRDLVGVRFGHGALLNLPALFR